MIRVAANFPCGPGLLGLLCHFLLSIPPLLPFNSWAVPRHYGRTGAPSAPLSLANAKHSPAVSRRASLRAAPRPGLCIQPISYIVLSLRSSSGIYTALGLPTYLWQQPRSERVPLWRPGPPTAANSMYKQHVRGFHSQFHPYRKNASAYRHPRPHPWCG